MTNGCVVNEAGLLTLGAAAGGRCVSHGVVEMLARPHPVHRWLRGLRGVSQPSCGWKSQGRTGGGSWLLDDRPDGVREQRYHDEVILVGAPAARPLPGLGWGAGGLVRAF